MTSYKIYIIDISKNKLLFSTQIISIFYKTLKVTHCLNNKKAKILNFSPAIIYFNYYLMLFFKLNKTVFINTSMKSEISTIS